jgi:hypothetical protein
MGLTAKLNPLTGDFDFDGINEYTTESDVELSTDAETDVLMVTLQGLTMSKVYLCTLRAGVYQYDDSAHHVGGSINVMVGASITSGSICTLNGIPTVSTSNLPTALSGAFATITTNSGSFLVTAIRKPNIASHARCRIRIDDFEDVT